MHAVFASNARSRSSRCSCELLWITGSYETPPNSVDYLAGTYPFGVGIFLLLLSSKRLGEFTLLTGLSKYSGGVYCAHMLFVRLLTVRQLIVGSVLWEIGRPFLILVLTYVFVMSAAKIRILKPVLT